MKLTVSDIRFSASSPVNVFATIDVESGKSLSPICSISVTVPMVEGKALEQYKDELLAKARELIAEIYKEIVCGGEHPCSNHDLEGRVAALEEFAAGITSRFNLYTLK
ncbi:TPA: hypothetical protein LT061_004757 [Salmonella enterica subsp. enterica serovar Blitta]|nr:hypothetical protein [Salmonella enterica subsp. enterica serovar Blitta]